MRQGRLAASSPVRDREVDELDRVALEDADDADVAHAPTVLLFRLRH